MNYDEISKQLAEVPQLEWDKITKLRLARAKHTCEKLNLSLESHKFLDLAIVHGLEKSFASPDVRYESLDDDVSSLACLQQMRHDGEPWSRMAPVAFNLFEERPSDRLGAQIMQLAILNGSHDEICAAMEKISSCSPDSYWLLAPEFRSFIVCLLWHRGKQNAIAGLFARREAPLLGVEQLCLFYSYIAQDEILLATNFYHRYAVELKTAVLDNEKRLGLSIDDFLFAAGSLLVRGGFAAGARSVLGEIEKDGDLFSSAAQLFLTETIARDAEGNNPVAAAINEKKTIKQKVRALADALAVCRKKGVVRYELLAALNETLADAPRLFPLTAEALGLLSRVLADQFYLLDALPSLASLFEQNMRAFHAPAIELALWQPLIAFQAKEKCTQMFWQGVAHMHCFLAKNQEREHHFWESFRLIKNAEQTGKRSFPLKWSELNRLVYALVARDVRLAQPTQAGLLFRLDLTMDNAKITVADIDRLIAMSPSFPLETWVSLRRITREQDRTDLEQKIICAASEAYHYTNQDLDRLWRLYSCNVQYDRAWTTATILLARAVLHETVRAPWQLSYEGRGNFGWLAPERNVIARVTANLSAAEARFIEIMVEIGPMLPSLMAALDPKSRSVKVGTLKEFPKVQAIEANLDRIGWLGSRRVTYYLAGRGMTSDYITPAFARSWPDNPWSWTLLCLARRLGFSYFFWSTERLAEWLPAVKDDLGNVPGEKIRNILGKWLRELSLEQRNAWHQLTKFNFAEEFSARRGQDLLGICLVRLATAIYPHHLLALTSLAAMQAPVVLMWELEKFLMSEGYMSLREKHGLRARAAVPQGILRLDSVCQAAAAPLISSEDESSSLVPPRA